MIEELHIHGIGGIDEAHLSLSSGLTAITGESGAGKSSVVRSLELASGKRGNSSVIRSDRQDAVVEAIYTWDDDNEDDPYAPQEGRLFVRRELARNGRGKVFLQDCQAPLSTLSDRVQKLIVIQSQFAQLELLDQEKQLELVDHCGGSELASVKDSLGRMVRATIESERRLQSLRSRQKEITDRFQGAEDVILGWRQSAISPNVERNWEEQYERETRELASLDEIARIMDNLDGDGAETLREQLERTTGRLSELVSQDIEPRLSQALNDLWNGFEALLEVMKTASIPGCRSSLEESVERLETKLGGLRKLKRAAGVSSTEELVAYCTDADRELTWLEESHSQKAHLEEEVETFRRRASRMALELRQLRHQAAQWLEKRVNSHLSEMAMEEAVFSVRCTPERRLRSHGADSVDFQLSWGDGPPGPVSKMASGGELSRILLAVRLSLPEDGRPATVVFDEVEAGLGGQAAVLAGLKLKDLSRETQVILVTHEASIAALADRHFVVRRQELLSDVRELRGDERVPEIARMLSGDLNLNEAQVHASRLLQKEQKI
ncbi:MAG: DNA recombination protein RecN [Dethiosulfovibrio peptidovorans]|nr:MAG: DNA recombination protein RecN [Dethiosulfovibrio peptidovorans]